MSTTFFVVCVNFVLTLVYTIDVFEVTGVGV